MKSLEERLLVLIDTNKKLSSEYWLKTTEVDNEIEELWRLDMDEEEEKGKLEELIGDRNRYQGIGDGITRVMNELKTIMKEVK